MRINSHHFPHETTWKVVTYMDARLEPYRTLVSFLGEALGPDYEVVLHDLTSEEGTIAAIVNNNISGRTEGAPLSNMALRFIHGKVYEKQPYVAGYQGASQARGRLRSSTMFIKDGSELIGMLCINFAKFCDHGLLIWSLWQIGWRKVMTNWAPRASGLLHSP